MSENDNKKIVFVSGGSRGIGAGIATQLASSGYDIWLNYKSSEDAAQQVQDVEMEGFDWTDPSEAGAPSQLLGHAIASRWPPEPLI